MGRRDGENEERQASRRGRCDVLRSGIRHVHVRCGCDVKLAAPTGNTPLVDCRFACVISAAFHIAIERFELLLSHGENPNARDVAGTTALMYAISAGDLRKIKMLLDLGARLI